MRIKLLMTSCVLLLLLTSVFPGLYAITYPAIIYVPVTFYDFHSDRSNPEFEQRHYGQLRTGMVASTLGSDNKPILGTQPYMNYYMKYWFKPWESGARGDYTIPLYDPKAGFKEGYYERDPVLNVEGWQKEYQQVITYKGTSTVSYDTAFKNIVINDSLPFVHIGNGMYEYKNDEFFPLDNKGFGNEWNHESGNPYNTKNVNHNYSFTMELHYKFVKVSGMTFTFKGDDDVWGFLNKQLQIDLGGIHEAQERSFYVDNISGLQNGKTYDLDFFYAERHSAESHIHITTNMISAQSNLLIYANSGTPNVGSNTALGSVDSIITGQATTFYGHVFDSAGVWQPQYDKLITWSIDNSSNAIISGTTGDNVTVTITKANSSVVLIGKFSDPTNPAIPESEVRITLYTGTTAAPAPYTVKLYAKDGTPDSSGNTALGSSVSVKAGDSLPVYAHVFDSAGNWKSEMDQYVKWRFLQNETGSVINPVQGMKTTVTLTKSGSSAVLIASFTDPVNLARPTSEARLGITVSAAEAARLEIIENAVPKNMNGDDKFTELILDRGNVSKAVYAILRDRFGNYIGNADLALWRSDNTAIVQVVSANGTMATVSKDRTADGEETYITATQNGFSDSLKVTSAGNQSFGATPNPFIPGVTQILITSYPNYENVISEYGTFGTLVGVETSKPLVANDESQSVKKYGKVVIYDALGNVVRSDLELVMGNLSRTYGVVWDGTSLKGRYVAPGTYYWKISAKMIDGKPFSVSLKVGITRQM